MYTYLSMQRHQTHRKQPNKCLEQSNGEQIPNESSQNKQPYDTIFKNRPNISAERATHWTETDISKTIDVIRSKTIRVNSESDNQHRLMTRVLMYLQCMKYQQ